MGEEIYGIWGRISQQKFLTVLKDRVENVWTNKGLFRLSVLGLWTGVRRKSGKRNLRTMTSASEKSELMIVMPKEVRIKQ